MVYGHDDKYDRINNKNSLKKYENTDEIFIINYTF